MGHHFLGVLIIPIFFPIVHACASCMFKCQDLLAHYWFSSVKSKSSTPLVVFQYVSNMCPPFDVFCTYSFDLRWQLSFWKLSLNMKYHSTCTLIFHHKYRYICFIVNRSVLCMVPTNLGSIQWSLSYVFQPGRLKKVQAIGWYLEEANMAQVSVNITDFEETPIYKVYDEVNKDAKVKLWQFDASLQQFIFW